jgi:hypothetical protein
MINSIGISRKGQIGGLTLLEKYGREHFAALGKLGGRPSFQDTLPAIAPDSGVKNIKEVKPAKATLTDLKALWISKQGSGK